MEVRVVWGLSATMATFWPTRALSSVDLPALGRPIKETKPERNLGGVTGSLMRQHLASEARSHECERCTQECVRHIGKQKYHSWATAACDLAMRTWPTRRSSLARTSTRMPSRSTD